MSPLGEVMYGAGGAAKYEAGEYLDVCEMIPSAFENAAGASSQHLIKMGALSTSYRFDGNPAAVGVVGNQARILSSTGRSASLGALHLHSRASSPHCSGEASGYQTTNNCLQFQHSSARTCRKSGLINLVQEGNT